MTAVASSCFLGLVGVINVIRGGCSVFTRYGQWVVDIPFTDNEVSLFHLVSVLFGSLIPTLCSILLLYFHSCFTALSWKLVLRLL